MRRDNWVTNYYIRNDMGAQPYVSPAGGGPRESDYHNRAVSPRAAQSINYPIIYAYVSYLTEAWGWLRLCSLGLHYCNPTRTTWYQEQLRREDM